MRGKHRFTEAVMSLSWAPEEVEYFRKVGIRLDEEDSDDFLGLDEPKELRPSGYLVLCAWFFLAVLGGMAWYGLLLGAAWLLRFLGVNITGI
jgi:hypothetical protein